MPCSCLKIWCLKLFPIFLSFSDTQQKTLKGKKSIQWKLNAAEDDFKCVFFRCWGGKNGIAADIVVVVSSSPFSLESLFSPSASWKKNTRIDGGGGEDRPGMDRTCKRMRFWTEFPHLKESRGDHKKQTNLPIPLFFFMILQRSFLAEETPHKMFMNLIHCYQCTTDQEIMSLALFVIRNYATLLYILKQKLVLIIVLPNFAKYRRTKPITANTICIVT